MLWRELSRFNEGLSKEWGDHKNIKIDRRAHELSGDDKYELGRVNFELKDDSGEFNFSICRRPK